MNIWSEHFTHSREKMWYKNLFSVKVFDLYRRVQTCSPPPPRNLYAFNAPPEFLLFPT